MRVTDHGWRRFGGGMLAAAALLPGSANGAITTSNSVTISTTVPTSCVLTARQDMQFRATILDTSTQSHDAEGVMRVNCTNGSVFGISLPQGANDNGVQRRMSDGAGHYLLYDVYASSSDRSSGTPLYPAGTMRSGQSGDGADHDVTFYGRIGIQSTPAVGSYADQLTVAVDW
ncbi:spore coat U domain-containing protein [Sphingomonas sp.]|uniref:Csu type fimbrial protein n=1 Tax=Sphingomonas sp. TaxID=28214 RepID=UPI0035C7CF13